MAIYCSFIQPGSGYTHICTQEALQHFRVNALLDPRTEELLKEFIRCKFI